MARITVITGPTCCGKSEAALKYALENDAEIISCDSVQVYRGMDIGSAKPDKADLAAARHHLIDVAEPKDGFDVAKYSELARKALLEILGRGKKAVVCGGSGFYLKAWFGPVADNIAIPDNIKKMAEDTEARGGAEALSEALTRLDPDAGKCIDLNNPRRTRKALERCLASGKSVGELRDSFLKMPSPIGDFEKDLVILDLPDAELRLRIESRARAMIKAGLIEETKNLIRRGLKQNPSAAASVGYRETISWIERGETDKKILADEIAKNTFALVKKQRKYFKSFLPADYPRRNSL